MASGYDRSRRRFMHTTLLAGMSTLLWPVASVSGQQDFLTREIPSSGERLPVIGLGSSRTFNVGSNQVAMDNCANVIQAFMQGGGVLIDSSPMYASSQPVIGYGLNKLSAHGKVFAADKVWIGDPTEGPGQMEQSRQYWGVTRFDLMQVHNLVAWPEHLQTLHSMKQAGRLRYAGITTSHGRRHDEFEAIMRQQQLDFVQFTYNILDREAEARLLPLAAERGIAVIVNRPFQRGHLLERLARYPLPAWAKEISCQTWAQFLLKFIVSHPAVTLTIPATTRVDHVTENMQAMYGPMPDAAMRQRMLDYVKAL